jgi:hypothetical protein
MSLRISYSSSEWNSDHPEVPQESWSSMKMADLGKALVGSIVALTVDVQIGFGVILLRLRSRILSLEPPGYVTLGLLGL